jgi:SPP1 family predicted phage head-tail adaptor
MPECKNIRKKHRKICAGDLRDYGQISSRQITTPTSGGVDFGEVFTVKEADAFMMIESKRGEKIFDDVDVEQEVTHHIYIRFLAGLTYEDWVIVEGNRYDILDVEDLDNRHEFQLLRCTNRGLATKPATNA